MALHSVVPLSPAGPATQRPGAVTDTREVGDLVTGVPAVHSQEPGAPARVWGKTRKDLVTRLGTAEEQTQKQPQGGRACGAPVT